MVDMVEVARDTTAAAMSRPDITRGPAIADITGEAFTSASALPMDMPTVRATTMTPATRMVRATAMIRAIHTDRLLLRSLALRARTIRTAIGSLTRTAIQINSNTIPTSRNSTRGGSPRKIDTCDQGRPNRGAATDLRDFTFLAAGPLEKQRSLPMILPDPVGSWRPAIEIWRGTCTGFFRLTREKGSNSTYGGVALCL